MSLLRSFGKKQVDVLTLWLGSAGCYCAGAGVAVTYFTDWKLILQYLPYYNGKFPPEESS